MAEQLEEDALDPDRSNFILIVGRKGSGKSELGARYFATYPHDRLVIDPTGDVVPPDGTVTLREPIPVRFEDHPVVDRDGKRIQTSYRYHPDVGDPTHEDEVDRAVGMCFHHPRRRSALWIDEVDVVAPNAARLRPNMHRALKQGRHKGMTLIVCGIRPMAINPLFLSQADYVATFTLPNPDDRKRVSSSIGVEPREFDRLQGQLDDYEFLWCDVRQHTITHCPPIPGVR